MALIAPAFEHDMIRSMTAFARTTTIIPGGEIVWEMRSVNHRFLEVMLRMPDSCRELEQPLREQAKAALGRGRIDATMKLNERRGAARVRIDADALQQLIAVMDDLRAHQPQLAAPSALDVLRWPGVVSEPTVDTAVISQAARRGFEETLAALVAARAREGALLAAVLAERLGEIDGLRAQLEADALGLPQLQRQRLQARVAELQVELDPQRLAQEVALLAQRADVREELDRLAAHVTEFRRAMSVSEPMGRHLDFMAQELNREANTLSSKAVTTAMTQRGVELKVLIEQIREQVQNVE